MLPRQSVPGSLVSLQGLVIKAIGETKGSRGQSRSRFFGEKTRNLV